MAEVKPLKLRREFARARRARALVNPYARVLVDHQIFHLEHYFDYLVPEELSETAVIGALVEVEIGHGLTQGIVLDRSSERASHGELKELLKVLSIAPYVLPEQITLLESAAHQYGTSPWDFIRSCVPPFSKVGERRFLEIGKVVTRDLPENAKQELPASLHERLVSPTQLICAIETPISNPYWQLIAAIAIERLVVGNVLVIAPNEREMDLLNIELLERGTTPHVISSSSGKSESYLQYLQTRSIDPKIILGTRSSTLLPLSGNSTIIIQDDVDESHYERRSPTWNTRDLVRLREASDSVIFISATIGLEIANRITQGNLTLFRFPERERIRVRSANPLKPQDYYSVIREGLRGGSVLVSVGATGYVTSFSCQKCRNVALCDCGGKLYFPTRATNPVCATCTTVVIGWNCPWCQESKPRILHSGVLRKVEEFGRAFPRHSIISSSAENPVSILPDGRHLVISTPGVEPRGIYAAEVFLDLEGRLLRTTLRATEELRFHILRTLSMIEAGGETYLDLLPSDAFLQSLLRRNTLDAAQREVAERDAVLLPPNFFVALVTGPSVGDSKRIFETLPDVEIVGPFLRSGKKSVLLKAPIGRTREIVEMLVQVNRVQSMRKEPLLSYRLNPYSLN